MAKKKKLDFKDIKTMKDVETWLNENDTLAHEKKHGTGGHVSIIYADGEHTSTKGGDLLFNRNEHQFGKPLIFNKRIYQRIKRIWEEENAPIKKMTPYDIKTVNGFIDTCADYYKAVWELAYELRQEAYKARDEREEFRRKWLEDNPMTYKYREDVPFGRNQKQRDQDWEKRKIADKRESQERMLKMNQEIPMPIQHLQQDKMEFYNLIEYMAKRAYAMTQTFVKATPESIWQMLLAFAPLDSDAKYYVDQFLHNTELKEQYKRFAVRINRLEGKYDHLMYQ